MALTSSRSKSFAAFNAEFPASYVSDTDGLVDYSHKPPRY